MTEALFQYIWQTQQFDNRNLRTTRGERVIVIHPGYHNTDAGPDFLHAKIRIGNALWAGHVELHMQSSHWKQHRHSEDSAYHNVILHVVYHNDGDIRVPGHGEPLPTLELKPLISSPMMRIYQQFYQNQKDFACQDHFANVDEEIVVLSVQRMAVERLEEKAGRMRELWEDLDRDWLHTLFCLVARALAGPLNSDSMESLVRRLHPRLLLRAKDRLVELEALIFGTAGLLNEKRDTYTAELQKHFHFWQQKHPIQTMNPAVWKYARMRPDNFVDTRLAQFAHWIHGNDAVWSKMLAAKNWKSLRAIFDIRLMHYWAEHYRLGSKTGKRQRRLGDQSVRLIVINAVAPLIFLYGKQQSDPDLQNRAMQWLMELPPEKNKLVNAWAQLGITPTNGFEAQGLLYWRKAYCLHKHCAKCPVGHALLRKAGSDGLPA